MKTKALLDDNLGMLHHFFSVLLFQEPRGVWVAQGLEHDIAAHGPTVEAAKVAFERTILGYFQLAAKHHRDPIASLPGRAPDVFWQVWYHVRERETATLAVSDPSIPPAYVVSAITTETIPTATQ